MGRHIYQHTSGTLVALDEFTRDPPEGWRYLGYAGDPEQSLDWQPDYGQYDDA